MRLWEERSESEEGGGGSKELRPRGGWHDEELRVYRECGSNARTPQDIQGGDIFSLMGIGRKERLHQVQALTGEGRVYRVRQFLLTPYIVDALLYCWIGAMGPMHGMWSCQMTRRKQDTHHRFHLQPTVFPVFFWGGGGNC